MKHLKIVIVFVLALFIVSCKSNSDKLSKEINEKEKEFYLTGNPVPDKEKVNELLELYSKFADSYPKDSLTPVFLYKAATLSMNTDKSENAIIMLDRIINDYNDFPKLPETFFLKAFIYDNNIKNINKAREAYTVFLQKFPKNDLANDAAISLDNLGKTPEQIVNEFQAKEIRRSDSIQAAEKQNKR